MNGHPPVCPLLDCIERRSTPSLEDTPLLGGSSDIFSLGLSYQRSLDRSPRPCAVPVFILFPRPEGRGTIASLTARCLADPRVTIIPVLMYPGPCTATYCVGGVAVRKFAHADDPVITLGWRNIPPARTVFVCPLN